MKNQLRAFPNLENDSLILIQENRSVFDFRFNTHTYFPESGSGKRFQASGMRTIDSSHKISPHRVIFEKKKKLF